MLLVLRVFSQPQCLMKFPVKVRHHLDPAKTVTITFAITATILHVSVEDQGTGFDPASVPDPTEDANLEIPSGRGLMLMRAYMTEVNVIPPGNRIEMYFRRDA